MAITDAELTEIEQRLSTITDTPWQAQGGNVTAAFGPTVAVCPADMFGHHAQFIAQAPEDIGRLLAEVKRLRG